MAAHDSDRRRVTLGRLASEATHTFSPPTKRIHDGNDLNFFLSSAAYRDLTVWLLQLDRSMFSTRTSDIEIRTCTLTSPPTYSTNVNSLRSLLDALASLLERAPPSTGPRRFGNVAFRDWYRLAEEEAEGLLRSHLASVLQAHAGNDVNHPSRLLDELKTYLLGAFGSAQRLDYGTGHELSFLAFLGCLWKLDAFAEGEERAIVVGIVQPYLELVRKLILSYTLEPAGSHGVWGLDDHSFVPYIFGSAQLGPPIDPNDFSKAVPTEGSLPTAPDPSAVANKARTSDYKNENMYFSAIQFIYDVKKGPFWEHSPILYDISGLKDGWAKINKGMLKMYAAEVLGKFPVVQHFPFGSLFRWETDPTTMRQPSSVHAQQQPAAMVSKDAPIPSPAVGTSGPWAKPAGLGRSAPQMQTSTGIPSTRAPWGTTAGSGIPQAPQASGMAPTAAPWAATQRPPPAGPGIAPTAAPWARMDTPR